LQEFLKEKGQAAKPALSDVSPAKADADG